MLLRTLFLLGVLSCSTACLDPDPFPTYDSGATECDADCDGGAASDTSNGDAR